MKYFYSSTRKLVLFFVLVFAIQTTVSAQNNCLDFDGIDDYVECSSINPTNFTMAAWIKPNNANADQAIISNLNEGGLTGSELHIGVNGIVSFTLRNATTWIDVISTTNVITVGDWIHLAATYDGTVVKIYVNGLQVATRLESSYNAGVSKLTIGRRASGLLNFNGKIDDVKIWNKSLSIAELNEAMFSEFVGNDPKLLVHYNFNQGTDGGNNSGIIKLEDCSIYSRQATLKNFSLNGSNSNWVSSILPKNSNNNCLNFDGIDDYVNFYNGDYANPILSIPGNFSTGFTYMGWIKWGAFNSWSRLIDIGNGPSSNNILLANTGTSNSLTLSIYNGATPTQISTANILPLNTWVHVTATVSNTGVAKIYLNGVIAAQGIGSVPIDVDRSLCYLGKSNWASDSYFKGDMDNIAIWNRALSNEEIHSCITNYIGTSNTNPYIRYTIDGDVVVGGENVGDDQLMDVSNNNSCFGHLKNFALNGSVSNWLRGVESIPYSNNCLNFDGINDYMAVPEIATNLDAFTIETWFNASTLASSANFNGIFNTKSWVSGSVHFQINNSKIELAIGGASIFDVTYTFSQATWYHLAATYNAGVVKIYVNGILVGTGNGSAVQANLTVAEIGAWNASRYFSGSLDEYRIWNYARSVQAIRDSMLIELKGYETGLLACYNFNQGIAGKSNTDISTALNAASNKQGVLTNFSLSGTQSNWLLSGFRMAPITHAEFFSGTLNNGKLTLTWGRDAGGITPPEGYYIFASKTNDFILPTNGIEPIVESDLSDGVAVGKVAQGEKKYNTWVNEEFSTTYYFRIIPYVNSGSKTMYYCGGTIPNDSIISKSLLNEITIVGLPTSAPNNDWIDYNNDGRLDLFVNGSSLYKQNSNQTFTQDPILTQGGVRDWGDYNNDGYLDVVIGTTVYRNNGGTSFTTIPISIINPFQISWGDYDKDGDLDLLVLGDNYALKVYQNDGNNLFKEVTSSAFFPNEYGDANWVDINNDGFLDIVSAGTNANNNAYLFEVYTNNTAGQFSVFQTNIFDPAYPSNPSFNQPGKLTIGEFNNDKKTDFLLKFHSYFNNMPLYFYKNNNENQFEIKGNIKNSLISDEIIVDVNNDGWQDIIHNYKGKGAMLSIFTNNKNGTFDEEYSLELYESNINIIDYNNDGKIDIFTNKGKFLQNNLPVSNLKPNAISGDTAIIINNSVKFSWNKTIDDHTPEGGLTYNLRIGKTNGGSEVLAPNSLPDGSRKFLKPGNVGFDTTYSIVLPVGKYYYGVQAIDNAYLGSVFTTQDSITIDSIPSSRLEATILNTNSIKLKWKNGNGYRRAVFCKVGNTGNAYPIHSKTYISSSVFGEGDQIGATGWYCIYNGKADSAFVYGLSLLNPYTFHVVEYYGSTSTEEYLRKLPDGNPAVFYLSKYNEEPSVISGSIGSNASWGDYNNDGFIDFILLGDISGTKVFKNMGNNLFEVQAKIKITGVIDGKVEWVDYNNDGRLDIIITGDSTGSNNLCTKIYQNINDSTFTQQVHILLTGVKKSIVEWGDYNNDGNIDLFLGGESATGNVAELYKNNGSSSNYTFTKQENIQLFSGSVQGSSAWGDYNNDGWLDLVICNIDNANSEILFKYYLNNKDNSFTETVELGPIFLYLPPYIGRYLSLENTSITFFDINKDGFLDILLSGYSRTGPLSNSKGTFFFLNNKNGSFIYLDNMEYPAECIDPEIAIADFDNDNDLDVLFSGNSYPDVKRLYQNNYPELTLNLPYSDLGLKTGSTKVADYDNDGDIDMLSSPLVGYGVTVITKNNIYMKAGSYSKNKIPDAPKNLKVIEKPDEITISWDPVTGDETPFLTYNIKLATDSLVLNAPQSLDVAGYRNIPALGNTGQNNFAIFKNLPIKTYKVNVQAVDGIYQASKWSDTLTVEVKSIMALFSATTECLGDSTTFTDNSDSYDGIKSREWNFGDSSSFSYIETPKHLFRYPGKHAVRLIVINNNNVADTIIDTVYVKPSPIINFTATDACGSLTTTISNSTTIQQLLADDVITSWHWDFGDGKSSEYRYPESHAFNNLGSYLITLSVAAKNGCSSLVSKNILATAKPSAPLALEYGKPIFCKGDSVIYSVPYDLIYDYKWQRDGLTVNNTNKLTVKTTPGNYKVIVTNKLAETCKDSSVAQLITINPTPTKPAILSTPASAIICEGDSVKINTTSTGLTYKWFPEGSGTTASQAITATQSGKYRVITYLGACPSDTSNSINVTVNPLPEKPQVVNSLGVQTSICSNNNLVLSVENDTSLSYQWYNQTGFLSGKTQSQFPVTETGTYSLKVTSKKACSNTSAQTQITVNPAPAIPSLLSNGALAFCEGGSLQLSSPLLADSYTWLMGTNSLTENNDTIMVNQSGIYKLSTALHYTNNLKCTATSTDSVVVTVYPAPVLKNFTFGETKFCEGGSVTLNATMNDGKSYKFTWFNENERVSAAESKQLVATQSGNYWLEVVNAENNCTVESARVAVTVDKKPATPIIKEQNNVTDFCPGTVVKLMVDNASPDFEYQWQHYRADITGAKQVMYEGKLKEGNYSVVVKSGTCTVESEILTLTTKPAPDKPAIYARGPVEWLVMCGTNDASAYRWYYNNILIPDAKSDMYFANKNLGDYYVEINEGAECWTMSDIINIPTGEITSEIPELMTDAISVYPNPSDGIFQIALGGVLSSNIKVEVLNAMGKTLQNHEYKSINEFEVDLSKAKPGIYFCKIEHEGKMVIKKLLID